VGVVAVLAVVGFPEEAIGSRSTHSLSLIINMNKNIGSILPALGVEIGSWNELKSLYPDQDNRENFVPSNEALRLYVVATKLAKWLDSEDFFIIQVDNSNSPADDEVEILKVLLKPLAGNINSSDKTFMFSRPEGDLNMTAILTTVIYFLITFSWHAYLVSDKSNMGKRLAIQDGVVSLLGNKDDVENAKSVVENLKNKPFSM
jgi:hypothetical protein